MLSSAYRATAASRGTPGCQPDPCVCPACGGLDCLCRPRFFAGQLINEADLNLLVTYIREKDKLHNRALHGWGVVCGLEVVCSPCDGKVTVRQGYAIDPCGEDIIVCQDQHVDVCALIGKCRAKVPQECVTPSFDVPDPCADLTEEWVLAIRYQDRPTRGTAALRASTGGACCSACRCGGSSACGCSCHHSNGHNGSSGGCGNGGYSTGRTTTATNGRGAAPAQCEPTVVCESYAFEVYKKPAATFGPNNPDPGDLIRRFLCCLLQLAPVLKPPPAQGTPDQLVAWCCGLKAGLLDVIAGQGLHDCTLYARVSAYVCPQPLPGETGAAYAQRVLPDLALLFASYFQYCIRSALLPPCPGPVDDPRVPLATITVKRSPCQILRVCDWEPRRFVVTFPTLGYWLWPIGWSPGGGNTPPSESLFARIRELIARMCCRAFERRAQTGLGTGTVGAAAPPAAERAASVTTPAVGLSPGAVAEAPDLYEAFTLFAQAAAAPERTVDASTLFLGAVGARDAEGRPVMSDLEMRHPVEFLLAHEVAGPLVGELFARLFPAQVGSAPPAGEPAAGQPPETGELQMRLARMEETVQRQQQQIEALTARLGER